MTTEDANRANEQSLRWTLESILASVTSLTAVDADQVRWGIVAELASTAASVMEVINPEVT